MPYTGENQGSANCLLKRQEGPSQVLWDLELIERLLLHVLFVCEAAGAKRIPGIATG